MTRRKLKVHWYLSPVRAAAVGDSEASLRVRASVFGLARRVPVVSAQSLLSVGQRRILLAIGLSILIGLTFKTILTLGILIGVVTILYVTTVTYRFMLFIRSVNTDRVVRVSDKEARDFPSDLLPTYTILIPAFKEPEVIHLLLEKIARLEYPRSKLDVKVLIEADDDETIAAIGDADPGPQFELVFVPPADPRTKPKALNYGLTLANGELVAVFDAEDEPDPLQLRRAAIGLLRSGPEVVCLQAKLAYHNPTQNLITKWFSIEYAMWFSFFLPGLATSDAPIPLGGTSNHFRVTALKALGAWDPFNVTEDADLGIRMHREGYRVGVLDSTTLEEANSDFVNWVRQRSRWYKGYLQTFIVHMREPRSLHRQLGTRGLTHFCLFVGGTPALALLNPVFWILTSVWFVAHPPVIKELFPAPIFYLALLAWAFGNFLFLYLTVISCRLIRNGELLFAALVVPLYWIMMAMAAVKAAWQLVVRPTHWEKTFHGLGSPRRASEAVP